MGNTGKLAGFVEGRLPLLISAMEAVNEYANKYNMTFGEYKEMDDYIRAFRYMVRLGAIDNVMFMYRYPRAYRRGLATGYEFTGIRLPYRNGFKTFTVKPEYNPVEMLTVCDRASYKQVFMCDWPFSMMDSSDIPALRYPFKKAVKPRVYNGIFA